MLRALYVAFIQFHLEYGVPVWDPHSHKYADVLEAVQCLLQIYTSVKSWNTLHYQEHLDQLHLDTLQERSRPKQCHLFKLVHDLSNFPSSPITIATPSCYNIRSNDNLYLNIPFSYSNAYYYHSFFFVMLRIYGTLCLILFNLHKY